MTLVIRRQYVVLLGALIVCATARIAYPEVPKAEDIAACNTEAQRAAGDAGSRESAGPTAKDHNRAAEARTEPKAPDSGSSAKSEDPQLAGIDAEGAKNPAYQAAYRTCMRKSGF